MQFNLSYTLREGKKLHTSGKNTSIPGIIYGPQFSPKKISLAYKDFVTVFKQVGESQVIELESEEGKEPVLIHEVQIDPLSGHFMHVDFYRFLKGSKVHAIIPLEFYGVSSGVKDKGGTLFTNLRELNVRATPDKLISVIHIDLNVLKELGDMLTVGDLIIPEGIEILNEPSEIIVSVVESAKEASKPAKEIQEEAPIKGDAEQKDESSS